MLSIRWPDPEAQVPNSRDLLESPKLKHCCPAQTYSQPHLSRARRGAAVSSVERVQGGLPRPAQAVFSALHEIRHPDLCRPGVSALKHVPQ